MRPLYAVDVYSTPWIALYHRTQLLGITLIVDTSIAANMHAKIPFNWD